MLMFGGGFRLVGIFSLDKYSEREDGAGEPKEGHAYECGAMLSRMGSRERNTAADLMRHFVYFQYD